MTEKTVDGVDDELGAAADTWVQLLARWLPGNADPERPVMTLASVDAEGYPDARTVLLSEFDERGSYFHTDSGSRKVVQLSADPRACATVLLDDPLRQIVLQGAVEPLDQDALLRAWRSRSRYLQVLGWLNTVELVVQPASVRHAVWREFEERHPSELDPPPTWTGYLLRPRRITFWVTDPVGPSRRREYENDGSGWSSRWLPG